MNPYNPTNDFAPTIKREGGSLGVTWLAPTSLGALSAAGRVRFAGYDNAVRWELDGVRAPDGSTTTAAWTLAYAPEARNLLTDPGAIGNAWVNPTPLGQLADQMRLSGFDRALRFELPVNGQPTAWEVPEAAGADKLVADPKAIGGQWIAPTTFAQLMVADRLYIAVFQNGMLWGIRGAPAPGGGAVGCDIWTVAEAGAGDTFCPGLRLPKPPTYPSILNREGEEIGKVLAECAAATGLPLWFCLACAKAESGLSRYAERWDGLTPSAKTAIADGNMAALQNIIDQSGEDISFSYGQQTLQLFTQKPYTTQKALDVRAKLFNDPNAAMLDMCQRIAANLNAIQGVAALSYIGGDTYLGALCQYNSGSYWRTDPDGYFSKYAANVANYRGAITWAKALVGA